MVNDNDCRSLDFYLISSKETFLKYLEQLNNLVKENIKSRDRYKQQATKEQIKGREVMPLHGQFERDTKG